MPVNPPDSGTPITKASITSMYDTVRDVANEQTAETISRGTFGDQHLPSIVRQADFLDVTTPVTIPGGGTYGTGTPLPTFDEATTYATWQVLTPYTMDNGGAGYTLSPGLVLAFASVRWSTAASALATGPVRQELWLNFNYRINGTLFEVPINNRMLRNMTDSRSTSTIDPAWPGRVEETFTWWRVLDLRSLTPSFNFQLGIKGVNQRATGSDTSACVLPNGHIGFVNLYGG
jgi:hypothetical protein